MMIVMQSNAKTPLTAKPTHYADEALRNATNAKRPPGGWPWEHKHIRLAPLPKPPAIPVPPAND
jgi:hypothetical protein